MSRKSCPVARQVEILTVTCPVAPFFRPPLSVTSSEPNTTVLLIPGALVGLIVS